MVTEADVEAIRAARETLDQLRREHTFFMRVMWELAHRAGGELRLPPPYEGLPDDMVLFTFRDLLTKELVIQARRRSDFPDSEPTWETIDAAPKDRTILVYDRKPGPEYGPDIHTAFWDAGFSEGAFNWRATEDVATDPFGIDPTHWLRGWEPGMPIPEKGPEESEG